MNYLYGLLHIAFKFFQASIVMFMCFGIFTTTQAQNCLLYDGSNDYVNISAAGAPINTALTDWTIELWVRVDGGNGTYRTPINSRYFDGEQTRYGFNIYAGDDNNWQFYYGKGVYGQPYGVLIGSAVSNGVWTHLAIVRKGSEARFTFYVDGNIPSGCDVTGEPFAHNTTMPFNLGSLSPLGAYWNGRMSEVRFWNVARTQPEIQTSMNTTLIGNEAGLVAYWSLNQTTGTTATDNCTNGGTRYNGTLINFSGAVDSWWVSRAELPLPVELTSFKANYLDKKVILNWQTATEVNNYGFGIERLMKNEKWEKIGFVNGNGNSNSPKNYSFTDLTNQNCKVVYRLKQIDFSGNYEYSKEVEVFIDEPTSFVLKQNQPNPFNPETTIEYSISSAQDVTLIVYDLLGREIKVLVNEYKQAGNYSIQFDGSKLASGVYVYQINAGRFFDTKKFVLMK